jgi:hypothetical protein
MKKIVLALLIMAIGLTGCSQASTVSSNISKSADNFEVQRRVIFYNGITGEYMLTIEGLCSLGGSIDAPQELTVTCKVGPNEYKKHFLGLSDNVTYFAEHVESSNVNPYQYRVIFRPTTIVPDIEVDLP